MKFLSNPHLFWDVAISSLDSKRHAQAIIERVIERGSWEEIKEVVNYYGKEKVTQTLRQARWLSDKTMHFASGYFMIPLEEMRCYTQKRSHPVPYL